MSSIVDHTELKHLERRETEINATVKSLLVEKQDVEQRLKREQETFNGIRSQISKLKSSNTKILISEHAILRYIERVMGVDIEEVKRKIVPESIESHVRTIGSGVYPADTHRIKVQNNVVVTILTERE